jgi:hypothetical protein
MTTYQRVMIPMPITEDLPDTEPTSVDLYGFVRLVDGKPEHTYCASTTPSVFVEGVGWNPQWPADATSEAMEDWDGQQDPPDNGYFSVKAVKAGLYAEPFEAEDDDEAMEECHGNW